MKKIVFVLLDKNNEILGSGSEEKVKIYMKQLLERNLGEVYSIEERVNKGDWFDGLKYSSTELIEYNGVLYPRKNINYAENKQNRKLSELGNLYSSLKDIQEGMSDIEKEHCETVLNYIDKKYSELENK